MDAGLGVSILIRPFDRMRPGLPAVPLQARRPVSILIRPFDRMRHHARIAARKGGSCFNPHPAFRPDATAQGGGYLLLDEVLILIRPFDRMRPLASAVDNSQSREFQSSSGLSTGCDTGQRGAPDRPNLHVSILIRPFDRMRLRNLTAGPPPDSGFQSSSGLSTGCDRLLPPGSYAATARFQSSSGLSTGCDAFCLRVLRDISLFQSSSGLSTGCDSSVWSPSIRSILVSILIRPFDRMRPRSPWT